MIFYDTTKNLVGKIEFDIFINCSLKKQLSGIR